MTKRNRILCLCLAILATAAVAFFLLYPHTTGPVLPRSGDAHIQAVELRADGELRVWSPKTEEDREKELVIWTFWQRAASGICSRTMKQIGAAMPASGSIC